MEDRLNIEPSGAIPRCTSFTYGNERSKEVAVSVIVPVYNVESYLGECLESILSQSFSNFEVICVDDGSTDGSLCVLQKFARRDKRVRIASQQNMGLPGARNHGLSLARGSYICFVDSDDALAPQALTRLIDLAQSHNSDIVIFGFDAADSNHVSASSEWPFSANPVRDIVYRQFDPKALFNEPGSKPFVWRYFIRRSLLTRHDIWFREDLSFGEDMLFQFSVLPFATNITFSKMRLYRYRIARENSLMANSNSSLKLKVEMHIRIVDLVFQTWTSIGILSNLKDELVAWAIDFVFLQFEGLDEEDRSTLVPTFTQMLLDYIDLEEISLDELHLHRLCIIASYETFENRSGLPPWLVSAALAERHRNDPLKAVNVFAKGLPDPIIKNEVRTIAAFYHRIAGGGAEEVMRRLLAIWSQSGYEVVLIAEELSPVLDGSLPNVKSFTLPRFNMDGDAWYIKRAKLLSDILASNKVDVLVDHAWNSAGLVWDMITAQASCTAFMVYCHNLFCLREINAESYFSQQPYVFAQADAIACLSDVDAAFWSQFNGNVFVVTNPLENRLFRAPQAPLDDHNLIWIGRFSSEKRPEDAIHILAQVREGIADARLIMLGTGETPADTISLQKLAEHLGVEDAVDFCGFQKDVSSYLEKSSLALVTSEYEGFHLALFETMAHGVPAVIYELPNITWVNGTNGVSVVPNGDIREAAQTVASLLQDANALHRAGVAAKRHIGAFESVDQQTTWSNIFTSLTLPRPPVNVSESEKGMWRALLTSYSLGLDKINSKHDKELSLISEGAARDLQALTNSLSFRIGRILTFLPRKLRDLLRRS